VFTYDRRSDTYAPDDARTLVKNSYRLQALKPRLGMTEDEIAEELEKRANFLVGLLKEKKFAYSEVAPALMNYYAGENE
jgi:hypothetical protein